MGNGAPHRVNQLVWGLVILALGCIFLLDNLRVIEGRAIVRLWPVILVIFGIMKVVQSPRHGSSIFGWILIFVGGAMTLHRLDVIYFRFSDWWPALLIVVGAGLLFKGWLARTGPSGEIEGSSDDSFLRASAFLGGTDRKVASANFRGGDLTAVMGGLKIDLRHAEMQSSEAVVDLFAFMGGVELLVPSGWSVSVQATPILGGFEDRTAHPPLADSKKLVIRGSAIMGGVEVRN